MNPSPGYVWGANNLKRALWGLGRVHAREHSFAEAAVLFAAAQVEHPVHPPWIDEIKEAADHQECMVLVQAGLSPDALLEAEQRGAAMTLEQAVSYALSTLEDPPTARQAESAQDPGARG